MEYKKEINNFNDIMEAMNDLTNILHERKYQCNNDDEFLVVVTPDYTFAYGNDRNIAYASKILDAKIIEKFSEADIQNHIIEAFRRMAGGDSNAE